jgi:hypothetical protein
MLIPDHQECLITNQQGAGPYAGLQRSADTFTPTADIEELLEEIRRAEFEEKGARP